MRRYIVPGTVLMLTWLLLAGCSGKAVQQVTVLPDPPQQAVERTDVQGAPTSPPPPCDLIPVSAAKAQGIQPDQVLAAADFEGAQLGAWHSHAGRVVVWQTEPNGYRARASLNLGGCQWRSTAVTTELIVGPEFPLAATITLLNDVDRDERLVPLWAVYGVVQDAAATLVQVHISGTSMPLAQVQPGGVLAVVV